MTPMSDPQRRRIFALVRELGWDEDTRRAMLTRWIGKPSLAADAPKPIAAFEAAQVIRQLNSEIRRQHTARAAQKKRRRRNHPTGVPTPEQLHRLNELRRAVFTDADAKFRAFCTRIVKTEDPRWMSARQVVTLTLALERMRDSGWRPNTPARSTTPRDESASPADYPRTSTP